MNSSVAEKLWKIIKWCVSPICQELKKISGIISWIWLPSHPAVSRFSQNGHKPGQRGDKCLDPDKLTPGARVVFILMRSVREPQASQKYCYTAT